MTDPRVIWVLQATLRELVEENQEEDLREGAEAFQAMIDGLLAGKDVKPFQWSQKTEQFAYLLRGPLNVDRLLDLLIRERDEE